MENFNTVECHYKLIHVIKSWQDNKWRAYLESLNKLQEKLKDESGSISILIFGLFFILLIVSIGLIDTTDAFMAKRELVGILEPGVQRSVRSIDLKRYYQDSNLGERVPVDCAVAMQRAEIELSQMQLRQRNIEITRATCLNDELIITAKSSISPLIDFPIFHSLVNGAIPITAQVGASSIYR